MFLQTNHKFTSYMYAWPGIQAASLICANSYKSIFCHSIMITRGFAASQLSSRCYIRHARVTCTPLHVTSGVSISTASNRMQAWEMSDFWHCNHYSMFSIDPLPQLNPYWPLLAKYGVSRETSNSVERGRLYFIRILRKICKVCFTWNI